jgi:hypothetical protein
VDGWQGALEARRRPQFLEGQIGLLLDQGAQLVLRAGDRAGRAAGAMVLGAHILEAAALLQEFLDHAQRNPKPLRHCLPGALPSVVGGQNPFP